MSGDGLSRGVPAQDLPENQDESVRFMQIGEERYKVNKKGELGDRVKQERNFSGATPNPEPVELSVTEITPAERPDMPHIDSPQDVTPINEPAGNPGEPDWAQDGPAEGGSAPEEDEVEKDAAPAEEPDATDDPVNDVQAPVEVQPKEDVDVPKRKRK